jgi:hypothetical protein
MMVKGRNEPVAIARVAHVIAQVKGISVEEVSEAYVGITPEFLYKLTIVLELGETPSRCSVLVWNLNSGCMSVMRAAPS